MAIAQIQLSGDYVREEYLTAEAITPGHLCEIYNASGTAKVRKHNILRGAPEKMFAVEDALRGKTIDDAYASADLVSVNIVEPTGRVRAWLKGGESVVHGDKLESSGDGTLRKAGTDSSSANLEPVAVALEVLDLSILAAARITVRVL